MTPPHNIVILPGDGIGPDVVGAAVRVLQEVGQRAGRNFEFHTHLMTLVLDPGALDVVLTENLFGDILSDEAGAICGSLGLLPSASLGDGPGLFEPVHGSAPSIAGQDRANPIGAIASAAMLLRDGLGLVEEGDAIDRAIEVALDAGRRTADIAAPGEATVGTTAMADAIIAATALEKPAWTG